MRNILSILSVLCLFGLTACEKEETPVVLPPKPADVSLMTVELGSDYHNQVFVNLYTGKQTEVRTDCWDLAFDASADGYSISMNGGNNVLIANSGSQQFSKSVSTGSLKWKWDAASGITDSLVLGNCINSSTKLSYDSVYVINRGKGNSSKNYFQFKIVSVSATDYVIRIADLDGEDEHDITIPKDPSKLHVYFSFDDEGTVLNFEPNKNDWHFCFLRYRWIYYEFSPPLLYQVTGVYTNTGFVSVAVDSSKQFYDITLPDVKGWHYSNKRDAIGFDWKTPDFKPSGVVYITRKWVNYIVREQGGSNLTYKMHFIDFYNNKGVKGTPRFEMQVLD